MAKRAASVALLFGVAGVALHEARAASSENAPAECVAQVAAAVRALSPVLGGKNRRVQAGAQGSIEQVVLGYVPGRFHPVTEGNLPALVSGASCPSEMALVQDRFCVDRYEGSLLERLGDGTTKAFSPYETPTADHVYLAQSVKGVVPQGYISAASAEAACRAVHKRLCQPVEWRAACAGSNGFAYPYGATRMPGKCHDSGASPMLSFHASSMKRGWGKIELNDPRNNQLEGTVTKTGSFLECTNDYGVYDMVGNLHEWTADPNGTFQGGYWLDTSQHGDGCAYRTIAHEFGYHDYSTGFRCCADVEASR